MFRLQRAHLRRGLNIVARNVKSKRRFYENAFVAISLTFGFLFIFISPPLWGLDEISHFARVYQISKGNIFPDKGDVDTYGGPIPTNLDDLKEHVIKDFQDNKSGKGGIALEKRNITSPETYEHLESRKFNDNETVIFTWTASYPPPAYTGNVAGVLVASAFDADIGTTIILSQIGGLLLFIAIIYLALRLQGGDSKLKPLIFAIALIPTSLYQASVVTVDGLSIALSLLLVSIIFWVVRVKPSGSTLLYVLLGLTLVGAILALTKVNYLLLGLCVVLLPTSLFKNLKESIVYKASSVSLMILVSLLWGMVNDGVGAAPVSQRPDGLSVSASGQLNNIISNPQDVAVAFVRAIIKYIDAWVVSAFNAIGNTFSTYLVVAIFSIIIVLLSAIYARPWILKYQKMIHWMAATSLFCVLSILLALYLVFNPVGSHMIDGVQGRYFLPLLLPLLLSISLLIPVNIQVKEDSMKRIVVYSSIVMLLITIGAFYMSIY